MHEYPMCPNIFTRMIELKRYELRCPCSFSILNLKWERSKYLLSRELSPVRGSRADILKSGPSYARWSTIHVSSELSIIYLLVNGKFEAGFLNLGCTVSDPLSDRTLPKASSQALRIRSRRIEADRRTGSTVTNGRLRSLDVNPCRSGNLILQ
jgi:hypothetical protein